MVPAQTRYGKTVQLAPAAPVRSTGLRVLKSSNNKKLGSGIISKGRYRGMPLFSLTLEERATCPSTCFNWSRCYGDNMPFAKRYQPGPELLDALEADLDYLLGKHEQVCVRLHILGDFYSEEYVKWWAEQLRLRPGLHLFGYTHWPQGTGIGERIVDLNRRFPDRVSILRSDGLEGDPLPVAMTVGSQEAAAPGTVLCPEQTHGIPCVDCGLCMSGRTSVSFRDHSRNALPVLPKVA